tara:strand:+ start:250 stop:552 length:303 start_codon:yes stop_codon:yes gene_type:complete
VEEVPEAAVLVLLLTYHIELEVLDIKDHLLVALVVAWEHLVGQEVQEIQFQHQKVEMVVMMVVHQVIVALVMDLVEAAVLELLVVMEEVLDQEEVVLEFR